MVGAAGVGNIRLAHAPDSASFRNLRERRQIELPAGQRVKKGDELGAFMLGSTVVLLFPPGGLQFNPAWMPGGALRMGEMMARRWVTRADAPGRT